MDLESPEFTPLFHQLLLADSDEVEVDEEDEEMSRMMRSRMMLSCLQPKHPKKLNFTSLLIAYQAKLMEELGNVLFYERSEAFEISVEAAGPIMGFVCGLECFNSDKFVCVAVELINCP